MRVLLIEDELATAKIIGQTLRAQNFVCDITDRGEDGLEVGRLYQYDLIILDLVLPDMDGYDVLSRFRASHIKTPILVLSGLSETQDKVRGLIGGADDYLTKPFSQEELLARIHAIVRRAYGHSESIVRIGKLMINLQSRSVFAGEKPINFTGKEYAVLELLALRKGNILTKEMFLNHLYGGIDEPELKIIDVFVCKVRRKIAKFLGCHGYIQTIWGQGYILKDPIEVNRSLFNEPRFLSAE